MSDVSFAVLGALSDKHKHKLWLIGRLWSVFYGVLTTLND